MSADYRLSIHYFIDRCGKADTTYVAVLIAGYEGGRRRSGGR